MAIRKVSKDPQAFIVKKQYDKAIKLYQEHLEAKPQDNNARLRLGDAYALADQKAMAVKTYKTVADDFAEKGFLLKAIGVNKKIVKLDPSQQDVHMKLSKLYEERGLLSSSPAVGVKAAAAEKEEPKVEVQQAPSPEIAVEEMPMDISVDELANALAFAQPAEVNPQQGTEAAPAPVMDLAPDDLSIDAEGGGAFGTQAAPTRTPLFSDLTAEELAEVISTMSQKSFQNGETIVQEGDRGDSLFVIVEGSVEVATTDVKGKKIRLATLKDGDFFGEVSLLTGKPRTATISAETETEVLELSRGQLDEVVKKYPRVQKVMKEFYEKRVQDTIKTVRAAQQGK